ncbi:hypothetical protein Agub_g8790, partial [Astrephomene gubernaculifera]
TSKQKCASLSPLTRSESHTRVGLLAKYSRHVGTSLLILISRTRTTKAAHLDMASPRVVSSYEEQRAADTLGAPYEVPGSLLRGILPEEQQGVSYLMECPLLCFVNAQSGSRKGAQLALKFSRAIGKMQVFDIGNPACWPDKVLAKLYENMRVQEAAGDPRVAMLRQRLRLVVCGGDGTIAWVMGAIKKLKLDPEPPIAIIPLGTGNDLARSFLWGHAYSSKWTRNSRSMYKTLNRIATASEDSLDCWSFVITAPRKDMFDPKKLPHGLSPPQPTAAAAAANLPYGPSTTGRISAPSSVPGVSGYGRMHSSSLPNTATVPSTTRDSLVPSAAPPTGDRSVAASVVATLGSATPLHNIATSSVGSAATTFTTATNMSMHTGAAQAGNSVPPTIVSGAMSTQAEEESGVGCMMGMFWNYFSVGLDAAAAWGFHSLREQRPGCTSSRRVNQFWYSYFGCATGWFCCAQPLNLKVSLEVLRPGPGGDAAGWQPVKLSPDIRALVVVNLQSYGGGRNLWGRSTSAAEQRKRGWQEPAYNDGTLEVVGLLSGWHTGAVMASKGALLHGRRICQAAGVRLAVQAPHGRPDGEPSHCYMQLDGEPWRQEIPNREQGSHVRVEIRHAGVSRLLRNDSAGGAAAASSSPSAAASRHDVGVKTPSAPSPLRATNAPVVTAVSEPGGFLIAGGGGGAGAHGSTHGSSFPLSQSQSSVQMSTLQQPLASPASTQLPSLPLGPGMATGGGSMHGPGSTSGTVLQHQVSGATGATSSSLVWERPGGGSVPPGLGSGRRASAASGAGSSVAEATEAEGAGCGAVASARGVALGLKHGGTGAADATKLPGAPSGGVASPTQGSPTPRTLSGDLDSQGPRSAAITEAAAEVE